jgi:hypothetical protein
MDTTAERNRLESEKLALEQYLDHPISKEILSDNEESQQRLINTITHVPIDSIEAFFNHWEAVGHLRGLRQSKQLMLDSLEIIESQLKDLPNE